MNGRRRYPSDTAIELNCIFKGPYPNHGIDRKYELSEIPGADRKAEVFFVIIQMNVIALLGVVVKRVMSIKCFAPVSSQNCVSVFLFVCVVCVLCEIVGQLFRRG